VHGMFHILMCVILSIFMSPCESMPSNGTHFLGRRRSHPTDMKSTQVAVQWTPSPVCQSCDKACFLKGEAHSCRARVNWLVSQFQSQWRAVDTVNSECQSQCSCCYGEFADQTPPSTPDWQCANGNKWEDCGYWGITRSECESRGCCYTEDIDSHHVCFTRAPLRPTPPPTSDSGTPASASCDHICFFKGEQHTCRDRVNWLVSQSQSQWQSIVTVNTECQNQCSCSPGDFTDPTPPPTADWQCANGNRYEDCGYWGITQSECESRGCCYTEDIQSHHICFTRAPLPPTPRPTSSSATPGSDSCDHACFFKGEQHTCRDRVNWLVSQFQSQWQAIDTVNSECQKQCSCSHGDFANPTLPPTPDWQCAIGNRYEDCGYWGITRAECESRGCCYTDDIEDKQKKCFTRASITVPPPSPPPTPSSGTPASETCDHACLFKGEQHTCRARVKWLLSQFQLQWQAIDTVNSECQSQCSCSHGNFANSPPPH
jgi:predicted transcriptional regulator